MRFFWLQFRLDSSISAQKTSQAQPNSYGNIKPPRTAGFPGDLFVSVLLALTLTACGGGGGGWIKSVLGFRQFSLRGLHRVQAEFKLVCLALNLRRMGNLRAA